MTCSLCEAAASRGGVKVSKCEEGHREAAKFVFPEMREIPERKPETQNNDRQNCQIQATPKAQVSESVS